MLPTSYHDTVVETKQKESIYNYLKTTTIKKSVVISNCTNKLVNIKPSDTQAKPTNIPERKERNKLVSNGWVLCVYLLRM